MGAPESGPPSPEPASTGNGTEGASGVSFGAVLFGALVILYPVFIWYGLALGDPRRLALGLLVLLVPLGVLRMRASRSARFGPMLFLPLVTIGCVGMSALLGDAGYMLATPSAINGLLLMSFGATLLSPPPMVERFARMVHSDLRPEEVRWCRLWTQIWCAFFLINGALAAALAIGGALFWWTFHTSIAGYLGMGALFGTEWLLRKIRFRRFADHAVDRWLAACFPAPAQNDAEEETS